MPGVILSRLGIRVLDFTLQFPDGSQTSFAELKGRVIMLQFTASWCSVCRKEMPHIEKEIWQPLKDQGLVLIGVDRDEPADTVKNFATENANHLPPCPRSRGRRFQQIRRKRK